MNLSVVKRCSTAALVTAPLLYFMLPRGWFFLQRLLNRRHVTLEDMPPDVMLEISYHLSVGDLRNLLLTSTRLFKLLQFRSIWHTALRNILSTTSIPRLEYALPNMTLQELINTSICMYGRDANFGRLDRPWKELHHWEEWPATLKQPILLPGGRYMIAVKEAPHAGRHILDEREKHKVVLYDCESGDLENGKVLVSPPEGEVKHMGVVACSATEVVIAVVVSIFIYERPSRGTSEVLLFRCRIDGEESKLLDSFPVDAKVNTFYLDAQIVAVSWLPKWLDSYTSNVYARAYETKQNCVIVKVKTAQLPSGMFITPDLYLILASSAEILVYQLPALRSTVGIDTPQDIETLWRLQDAYWNMFENPLIVVEPNATGSSHPPTRFAVWGGGFIRIMSRTDHDADSVELKYDVNRCHLTEEKRLLPIGASVLTRTGGICGLVSPKHLALPVFKILPSQVHGISKHSSPELLEYGFATISCLRQENLIVHSTYDQESGRMLLLTVSRTAAPRTVLDYQAIYVQLVHS